MLVRHVEIEPAYSRAIAQTANHYKVMVAELEVKSQKRCSAVLGVSPMSDCIKKSKVKSEIFTRDLEEIAGGVR